MTELSPAAQAVLDAVLPVYDDEYLYVAPMEKHAGMIAAAALHAAADAIAPVENELIDDHWYEKKNPVREQLLAIAHELEGQ